MGFVFNSGQLGEGEWLKLAEPRGQERVVGSKIQGQTKERY